MTSNSQDLPYAGCKISLISKSEIRYEGILHSIDSAEASVTLGQVRSFGSEGRRGGGAREVGESVQVYELIVFRGSDIKELKVCEVPPVAAVAGRREEHTREDHVGQDRAAENNQSMYQPTYQPAHQPPRQVIQQPAHQSKTPFYSDPQHSLPRNPIRAVQQQGEFPSPPNFIQTIPSTTLITPSFLEEQHQQQNAPSTLQIMHNNLSSTVSITSAPSAARESRSSFTGKIKDFVPKEFDFERSNSLLKKTPLPSGSSGGQSGEFYSKSSFFDSISRDSKAAPSDADFSSRKEKSRQERFTNIETFGVAAPRTTGPNQFRKYSSNRSRSGYRKKDSAASELQSSN